VIEVGRDVRDLAPGQRVACAGAASAHHAEIVAVPRNLVVPVPAGVTPEQAAFVTVGAIAMHGVRQADVRLGEIACVVGLGLIGQLTAALLRLSGTRVIAADTDPRRVERARQLGVETAILAAGPDPAATVARLTGDRGADAVLLTAATDSSEPLRNAVRMVRRRGRIVVVGAVGMELDRAEFYMKEAELRIACSYGPGRYDPEYEDEGRDYPYPYVRWTENRNMSEFLRLAGDERLPLDGMLDATLDIDDAAKAFDRLAADTAARPLALALRYGSSPAEAEPQRRVPVVRVSTREAIGVAVVGPGVFARQVHLPQLARMHRTVALRAVVGRSAATAREAARIHGAAYAATELGEVLSDDDVSAVVICTRHDRHVEQAVQSLRAGRAVFLEKPAALDRPGLERLESAVRGADLPFVLGFNRRFAPHVVALSALLESRSEPVVIDYRVNAGSLPRDHWALGPQGGGRLIGEACHMIDLLGHLVGHPREHHALELRSPGAGERGELRGDNFSLVSRHADGSLTTLTFTTLGHPAAGKERIECHWDGRTAVLDDFRTLRVHGAAGLDRSDDTPDKGHAELMRRFIEHVAGRARAPIPLDELFEVSRFVLELDEQTRRLDRAREA